MKISKLFHWLYAVLMLLPVAFIGVRCGYVMFNKNAKDSYSDDYVVKEYLITSETQFNSELIYSLSYKSEISGLGNTGNIDLYYISLTAQQLNISQATYDTISKWQFRGSDGAILLKDSNLLNIATIQNNENLGFTFRGLIPSGGYTRYTLTRTIYGTGKLDNAFEYSVNQLNEVPLFSWAQTSFLIAPFSYITGLFGLASTSPINTLLSYWLSISIIWLVFDLVMYLPLLVHRWLDKGVLE